MRGEAVETERIGQLFILGLDGTSPSPSLRQFAARYGLGGVILFPRNVRGPTQLRRLTGAVAALAGEPPLASVDQEGGRVARLGKPFTPFPSMGRLGRHGSEELAEAVGRAIGRELRAVGIAMNLAPVLDVHTNPANPIIGDRSLGGDPGLVSRLGTALSLGMMGAGVLPVGKHFPGHGDTDVDSHLALPVVRHGPERLRRVELSPFVAAIRAGIPALMTAHVLVPALDPDRPATLSPALLDGLLRGELGFAGAIISDDLEMGAIAGRFPVAEAAVRFLEAGGDLCLICRPGPHQEEAARAVLAAVASGRLSRQRIEAALGRIRGLRDRVAGPPESRPGLDVIGCPEHQALAEKVAGGAA